METNDSSTLPGKPRKSKTSPGKSFKTPSKTAASGETEQSIGAAERIRTSGSQAKKAALEELLGTIIANLERSKEALAEVAYGIISPTIREIRDYREMVSRGGPRGPLDRLEAELVSTAHDEPSRKKPEQAKRRPTLKLVGGRDATSKRQDASRAGGRP